MKTKREGISFRIFAQGDATVGDGCLSATVIIPELLVDDDVVQATRESLQDAFKTIFDSRHVQVLTSEEYAREYLLPTLEPSPGWQDENDE